MPDWKELVRERLVSSQCLHDRNDEVVAELAVHLEESYEAAHTQGLTETAAVELTLQQVSDWRVLAKKISQAKSEEDLMNKRTRSLWLPAMANVIVAPGLLMILQKLAVQPRVLWIGDMAMVLYLPWLIALPIFGAFGAFLARRAQARFMNRIIVGLSPALAVLGAFALVLPVGLVVDHQRLSTFPFAYFGLTIFNWVLLPALALLIGTLPFLRESPAIGARSTT
jgi:hypothetical protein